MATQKPLVSIAGQYQVLPGGDIIDPAGLTGAYAGITGVGTLGALTVTDKLISQTAQPGIILRETDQTGTTHKWIDCESGSLRLLQTNDDYSSFVTHLTVSSSGLLRAYGPVTCDTILTAVGRLGAGNNSYFGAGASSDTRFGLYYRDTVAGNTYDAIGIYSVPTFNVNQAARAAGYDSKVFIAGTISRAAGYRSSTPTLSSGSLATWLGMSIDTTSTAGFTAGIYLGEGTESSLSQDYSIYSTTTKPSSFAGTITAPTFVGALSGTATNATAATNATNATNVGLTDDSSTGATVYPLWATGTSGNLPAKLSSTKMVFKPYIGALHVNDVVIGNSAVDVGRGQSANEFQGPKSLMEFVYALSKCINAPDAFRYRGYGSMEQWNGTAWSVDTTNWDGCLDSSTSNGAVVISVAEYTAGITKKRVVIDIGSAYYRPNCIITTNIWNGQSPQFTLLVESSVDNVTFATVGTSQSSSSGSLVYVAQGDGGQPRYWRLTFTTNVALTGGPLQISKIVGLNNGNYFNLRPLAIGYDQRVTVTKQLVSSLATGTAPFSIASTTMVSNLQAQYATNLFGGATGGLPYQTAANTSAFLAISAANSVLTSTGSAPQWSSSPTLSGLSLALGSLGGTAGNTLAGSVESATTGNADSLKTLLTRHTTGANWDTATWRLYRRVDATDLGYIDFGPSFAPLGLELGVNSGMAVRIDNSKRVGIGKTPTVALDVLGAITASSGITGTTGTFSGQVNGSLFVEKYTTFTPTTVGWYRVFTSYVAGGGVLRVYASHNNKVDALELVWNSNGWGQTGQISIVKGGMYVGYIISQVRVTGNSGDASGYLDIYVSDVTSANPITLYAYGPDCPAFVTNIGVGATVGTGTTKTLTVARGISTTDQLISSIPTGTAPLVVASTTLVSNLNAEFLGGQNAAYYLSATNMYGGTLPSGRLLGSYTGVTGVGTLTSLSVSGTTTFATRSPIYSYWHGGAQDLAWKKIADITIGTALYSCVSFKIEVTDVKSNFGHNADCAPLTFFASCRRSSSVLNDYNDALVYGPVADYVRIAKTATGVYELQIRQILDWQFHLFVAEALQNVGTVTYVTGAPPNGSTAGTNYLPTASWTQTLPNLSVPGTITLSNSTSPLLTFSAAGVAGPAFTTRSVGTKIVLYTNLGGATTDFAFGIGSSTLWSSVPTTTETFKWYGGTTLAATLTGAGNLTLAGTLSTTQVTVSGTVYITGSNASLAIYRKDTNVLSWQLLSNSGELSFYNQVGVAYSLYIQANNNIVMGATAQIAGQFSSTLATGTAPFNVSSTTLCPNLNVQYLNGQLGSYYAAASSLSSYLPLTGGSVTGTTSIDGTTLYVDATNHRVGILKNNPAYPLDVAGRISYNGAIGEGADTTLSSTGTTIIHAASATWVAQQFFISGSNVMSLNSTGLTVNGLLKAGSGVTTLTDAAGKILSAALNTVAVGQGGTGATTLTGYIIGNGTGAFTAATTIPTSSLSGLGTGVATLLGGTSSGTGGPAGTASPTFTGTVSAAAIVATSGSSPVRVIGDDSTNGSLTSVSNNLFIGANVYFNGSAWVHAPAAANANNQMLTLSPGVGVSWYASNNSLPSWNVALGVTLWDVAGNWVAPVYVASSTSKAAVFSAGGILTYSSVTSTELGYVSGVTSAIQTQLNSKQGTITTLPVSQGGTGAGTLTGYVTGNGTGAFTASTSIPATNVTGTMSVSTGGTGANTLSGYLFGNGTSAVTASSTIPASVLSGTVVSALLSGAYSGITGVGTLGALTVSGSSIIQGSTGGLIICRRDTSAQAWQWWAPDATFALYDHSTSSNRLTITSAGLSVTGTIAATGTLSGSNLSGSSSGTNTGDQTNISGNAATATTATHIAGGVAGGISYQSGVGATAITGAGTSGQVLTSGGAGAPTWTTPSAGGGMGTVTSVSVAAANGVTGSVANATTTPAITLTLGAITPTSVAASGTVTGSNLSGTSSGTNTGDGVGGSGTTGRIPRFTGTTAVGNSSITDTGTAATATGTLAVTGATSLNGALTLGIATTAGSTGAFNIQAFGTVTVGTTVYKIALYA